MDVAAIFIATLSLIVSAAGFYRTWRTDRARLHVSSRMVPFVRASGIEIRAGIEVFNRGQRPALIRSVGFEAEDGSTIYADVLGDNVRIDESSTYSASIPIARILQMSDRRLSPFAVDGDRRRIFGERFDWARLETIGDVDWEHIERLLDLGPQRRGE